MSQNSLRPEIRNYVDAHHFLRDIYAFRKSHEPGFSYESWATELGITSRSHLRLSIIGRRTISDSLSQVLIRNLNLTKQEKDYFVLLILYSHSSTTSQKTYYAKKLVEFYTPTVERKSISPTLQLLMDPTVIALRLFLTFEDVSGSEIDLSQRLQINIEEVQKKLKILSSHGLVQEESIGQWRATSKWIQFEDHKDNTGIRAYHAASLDAAKKSIDYPVDTRYFRSLSWALNTDEYSSFLNDLNEFVDKMNSKYQQNILHDRKLMQFNMNLIPALILPEQKEEIAESPRPS